ncbi:MAG: hypothetical protein ACK4VI_05325 [Alphaproteobacteria bacterium]
MKQQENHRNSERGNVIFIILIAVVLFAALGFVVSNMLREGTPNAINEDRARLLASEIMDYGRTLRQGVQNMRISNGCTDTQISFEVTALAGYANGTNTACQLFHRAGGDVNYIPPTADVTTANWIFTGANDALNVGTTAPDLIAILPNIPLAVCNAINTASGITNLGDDSDISFAQFTGTYAATQTIDFADGKTTGCLNHHDSGDNYFFYQVLLAR